MTKLTIQPKQGCKKCYGRGHAGIDVEHGRRIYCKCVVKQIAEQLSKVSPVPKEVEMQLVQHEFRDGTLKKG